MRLFAYLDFDVPVSRAPGVGRRLLKPMVLAKMVQAAEVGATDRVLVVGCATGYSSALLARLAAFVVALEEDPALAKLAAANLREFAGEKATVVTGPLTGAGPNARRMTSFSSMAPSEIEPARFSASSKIKAGWCARRPWPGCRAMLYRSSGGDVSGWPLFDAADQCFPDFAAPAQFVF